MCEIIQPQHSILPHIKTSTVQVHEAVCAIKENGGEGKGSLCVKRLVVYAVSTKGMDDLHAEGCQCWAGC